MGDVGLFLDLRVNCRVFGWRVFVVVNGRNFVGFDPFALAVEGHSVSGNVGGAFSGEVEFVSAT